MPYRILLIDDDPSISEMLEKFLSKEGYFVLTAFNGEEGLALFLSEDIDLIVIDIMMPKLDGIEAIKLIRERSTIPILIISAKDTDVDKALGLGFGADDYLSKPFSLVEFSARIKASIRRVTKYANDTEPILHQIFTFGQLTVDLHNYSVNKENEEIKLTSKEFELLKLFITNQNRVFTKDDLYNLVWQQHYFGNDNVINGHIRRLREKIEDEPSNPKYIKTLWGIGYKWVSN
ncbi:response regulator transcription factor [Cytobacillus sp. FSL W7-1323]|uniref:DNA-binding response regulator n=1 Tax=Cytobacillus kochii TaxID=859143 RepID=A0A248TH38_9BACI|nr:MULTISPECIES: response regulator transcription factor [Cytobacillus]ASV67527.1 DNA-binding response regulator [Cytobacillus kochii]MEA1855664.1 response regulator transcription factor [Cytobacillus sp. OWB-43]